MGKSVSRVKEDLPDNFDEVVGELMQLVGEGNDAAEAAKRNAEEEEFELEGGVPVRVGGLAAFRARATIATIFGPMDAEVSTAFQKLLVKQGFTFKLGAKVTAVAKDGDKASVTFEPAKGGEAETLSADVVLVATGRKPYTDGLGLDEAGLHKHNKARGTFVPSAGESFAPGPAPRPGWAPRRGGKRCWRCWSRSA